jgi:hypothetical protein
MYMILGESILSLPPPPPFGGTSPASGGGFYRGCAPRPIIYKKSPVSNPLPTGRGLSIYYRLIFSEKYSIMEERLISALGKALPAEREVIYAGKEEKDQYFAADSSHAGDGGFSAHGHAF